MAMSAAQTLRAADDEWLARLDSVLERRDQTIADKQRHIDVLRTSYRAAQTKREQLQYCHLLAESYHVFQFDSAYAYADRGLQLAIDIADGNQFVELTLFKAELLAIGGLYAEAEDLISQLGEADISPALRIDFHRTYWYIYSYWASYAAGSEHADYYQALAREHLAALVQLMSADDPDYSYFMGEYHSYVDGDGAKAEACYKKALQQNDPRERVYAQSCFALASRYSIEGDEKRFHTFLIRAAICDAEGCIMENLALQFLAAHLFETDPSNLERAEKYINISMRDAKFYNNRLRILEVSRTLPSIVAAYQSRIAESSKWQRVALVVLAALIVLLAVALFFIFRQNRLLSIRRHDLSESNAQLTATGESLGQLNEKLGQLNRRLMDTNRRREGLAKIYIDMTARYIDKLAKYQTLVRRKIMAGLSNNLLAPTLATKLSESDTQAFLKRFDEAFIDLYPTFVAEFNTLLRPEHAYDTHRRTLPPELRIYALVRLGVKESQEIASLLFYSVQTIYNYRSKMKEKSLNKATFESDVAKLCTVI